MTTKDIKEIHEMARECFIRDMNYDSVANLDFFVKGFTYGYLIGVVDKSQEKIIENEIQH